MSPDLTLLCTLLAMCSANFLSAPDLCRVLTNLYFLNCYNGIYAPIAYRAKTQLNENSKVIAIAETLPEQNHNGVVIFDNPNVSLNDIAFIFLHDKEEPKNITTRFEEVKKLASNKSEKVLEIFPQGKSKLAKQLSSTFLIDFISIYLGILHEIDPSITPSIDKMKQSLKIKHNLQEDIEEEVL